MNRYVVVFVVLMLLLSCVFVGAVKPPKDRVPPGLDKEKPDKPGKNKDNPTSLVFSGYGSFVNFSVIDIGVWGVWSPWWVLLNDICEKC